MKTLRKVPLLLPLAGLLAGLLISEQLVSASTGWLIFSLGVLGVAFHGFLGGHLLPLPAGKAMIRELGLLIVALGLGVLWPSNGFTSETIASSSLPGGSFFLAGKVSKSVKETQYGSKCWLDLWAISQDGDCWESSSEKVLIYFAKRDKVANVLLHDTLFLSARVQPVRTKNEGYRDYLHQNGIYYQAQVKKYQPGGRGRDLTARLHQLQQKLGADLGMLMAKPSLLGIAKAMFLGDKSGLSPETRDQFSVSGLSHILAISGMHVGIVVLILGLLSKLFPGASGSRKVADAAILLLLALYVMLTGAGPAVVRAGIMFGAVLLARMLYLKTHVLNVVAFAAGVQLLYDPEIIFAAGFQLSYSAVIMLVLVYPPFSAWVKTPWWLLNRVFDLLGVSLIATLATGPLVYHYFGSLPTYFLLSNLLVGPILFVIVAGGFITVLICLFEPVWALGPAWMTEQFLGLLQATAEWIAGLPHARLTFDSWSNPALGVLLLQLGLVLLLFLFSRLILFLFNKEGSFFWSFSKY
jgi:competence protein ComEC